MVAERAFVEHLELDSWLKAWGETICLVVVESSCRGLMKTPLESSNATLWLTVCSSAELLARKTSTGSARVSPTGMHWT